MSWWTTVFGIIPWMTGSATVSSVNSSTATLPCTAATDKAKGRLACALTTVDTLCLARNGSTFCHAASISLDVLVVQVVLPHDLRAAPRPGHAGSRSSGSP